MEQFAEYGHAIVAMAVFALVGLLLGPVAAARCTAAGHAPGEVPKPDYGDANYRLMRASLNAVETAALFTAVTVAAILAGASPWWVNLLASVFLVSRLAVAVIHIAGIGQPNMGPRSIVFVIGWACCVILAIMAVVAVFA